MLKQKLQSSMPNGDAYSLSGKHNAKNRQEIMQLITGVKLPQSRCGVSAIRTGLFYLSGVSGSCLAEKEKNLANWIRLLP